MKFCITQWKIFKTTTFIRSHQTNRFYTKKEKGRDWSWALVNILMYKQTTNTNNEVKRRRNRINNVADINPFPTRNSSSMLVQFSSKEFINCKKCKIKLANKEQPTWAFQPEDSLNQCCTQDSNPSPHPIVYHICTSCKLVFEWYFSELQRRSSKVSTNELKTCASKKM